LETWCCEEAAVRASEQDHGDLALILDEMDDPDITTAEFNRLDAAFHVRIAESTGNALTSHLMGSLRTAINRQMIEAYARLEDWKKTAKVVRSEHRDILNAIRRGDAEAARRAVGDHIRSFYNIGNVKGLNHPS
jgi:DNA-binding FadR family transcriptional regulator